MADFAFLRLDRLPAPSPGDVLLELPSRLTDAGFDEESASSFQAIHLSPVALPALLRRNRGGDPACLMYRLWLLAQWVSRNELVKVFGPLLLERLLEWGLLAESSQGVGATVDIYPLDGDYLVTDRQIGLNRRPNSVYPLGIDSYSLQRLLPRHPVKSSLDLCTGSGVQALATQAGLTHAVDLSPRAVDFARFNLALNAQSRTSEVFMGRLFEPLPEERYDLIVANPPWVPTPDDGIELYRGGGLDGELITRTLLQNVEKYLAPEGWLVMYVEYPHYQGESYLKRVARWLGGDWGLALVNLLHLTSEEYVAGQVASHASQNHTADFERWMASYEKAGIEGMSRAVLYARRNSSSWQAELEAEHPVKTEAWVADWLESLDRSGPAQLHPEARLWLSSDDARVEWPDACLKPVSLNPAELATVQGASTELVAELRRRAILA